MKNAKRTYNYKLLRKPRTQAIRQLNNIIVITNIARNAIENTLETLRSGSPTKLHFPIPTIRDDRVVVARDRTKILSLLEQAATRDIYSQALVPAVAVTEGYLADMLALILRAFPKKLGTADKKIDLHVILNAKSLEEVLGEVISNQIHSAFYASPAKYFQYIEETLSVSIPDDKKSSYAEVKATRDIFVHNVGIVNIVYLEKAGQLARAREGKPLPLNERYFSSAIVYMKAIVQSVYQGLLEKYGDCKELNIKHLTVVDADKTHK